MTKQEHTPGPCSIIYGELEWDILSPEGIKVGSAYGKPNAQLWATTPEMKYALHCCLGYITGEHSNTEADKEEVLEIAQKAFTKATGLQWKADR